MYYLDKYSIIILLPVFILSIIIQAKLSSTYSKFKKIGNSRHTTGAEMAQLILRSAGVHDVSVACVAGELSDHFNPRSNTIFLSSDVYNGTSVASIGIAAHETGHALQYAEQYAPMKLRSAIVGITNFSSKILYLLIILSFAMNVPALRFAAVICFAVIFFFQVVTLPVEFNASARAVKAIRSSGFTENDITGVRKVLGAAAMTYVAAMLVSLAQLVTYILRSRRD